MSSPAPGAWRAAVAIDVTSRTPAAGADQAEKAGKAGKAGSAAPAAQPNTTAVAASPMRTVSNPHRPARPGGGGLCWTRPCEYYHLIDGDNPAIHPLSHTER